MVNSDVIVLAHLKEVLTGGLRQGMAVIFGDLEVLFRADLSPGPGKASLFPARLQMTAHSLAWNRV